MARVFIPPTMRVLTAGNAIVEVDGATVREVVAALDALYPGTRSQLCRDDQLRSGWMVVVNSAVVPAGLRERVQPDSEVHFLPAIGGG